jgi:hypothetical protein
VFPDLTESDGGVPPLRRPAPGRGVCRISPTKPLPAALQRWAEQRIGPVGFVRDASHSWDRSRVWDLKGERGVHHYLKV